MEFPAVDALMGVPRPTTAEITVGTVRLGELTPPGTDMCWSARDPADGAEALHAFALACPHGDAARAMLGEDARLASAEVFPREIRGEQVGRSSVSREQAFDVPAPSSVQHQRSSVLQDDPRTSKPVLVDTNDTRAPNRECSPHACIQDRTTPDDDGWILARGSNYKPEDERRDPERRNDHHDDSHPLTNSEGKSLWVLDDKNPCERDCPMRFVLSNTRSTDPGA